MLSNIIEPVRAQLDRYGITITLGSDAYFATAGQALEAFHRHTIPCADAGDQPST